MSSILDALVGGILLFVFCIALLIGAFVTNTVLTGMGDPLGLNNSFKQFFTSLNNVSIFIFLAMSLGAVLSALLIRAHPAFFFISVVLVIVEFLIIPPLANTYASVASSPTFATEQTQLAQNMALMANLPLWTAFATLVAALVGIGKEF